MELRVGSVCGLDLSALNTYWWHPAAAEQLDLARLPQRRLSAPFHVHTLDLQSRLDARMETVSTFAGGSGGSSTWEFDQTLEIQASADGQWNAIAFWFELCTGTGDAVLSTAGASCGCDGGQARGTSGPSAAVEAVPLVPQLATSWTPAVQYVDCQSVSRGSIVSLRVRQDIGQYIFTTHPPPCRPRHAWGERMCAPRAPFAGEFPTSTAPFSLLAPVPRWHFDMVLDEQRNEAYDAAIQRAVRRKRDGGCSELLALDMGAGSGLLSMMAARYDRPRV